MSAQLIIYTESLTNRVKYAFELLFIDVLGVKICFTDDEKIFVDSDLSKISYAYKKIDDELNFVPNGLLFQKGIEQFDVNVFQVDDYQGIFKVESSPLEFDLFSASFYLASRYEEYLPFVKDKHGRFTAKQSLAYAHDFIDKPLINIWAKQLKEIVLKKYTGLVFPKKEFKISPTIDVDSAFAFKEKGLIRIIAGFLKDFLGKDFITLKKRFKTVFLSQKDPFDVFDQLINLQKKYGWTFCYFFLVGDYDRFDKNISISSIKFQALIKHINDYSSVGLHPSFASNNDVGQLKKEVNQLSHVLHYPVKYSRQHFLKLHFPITYRNLIEFDISDDFSMGYPDYSGFRASICTSYYFYDLELDVKTNLKIHPFCFMEATYMYYTKRAPSQVILEAINLAKIVKDLDGDFNFVWHSDSISGLKPWSGWERTLENLLEELKNI